jgi:methyl-accepting chemotaxis protein
MGRIRLILNSTTAVAEGDLSKKINVEAFGEILELKSTVNNMVESLRSFSSEVTRVAREVGTDGRLGGQARVPGVAGTWKVSDNNTYPSSILILVGYRISRTVSTSWRRTLPSKCELSPMPQQLSPEVISRKRSLGSRSQERS